MGRTKIFKTSALARVTLHQPGLIERNTGYGALVVSEFDMLHLFWPAPVEQVLDIQKDGLS